MANRWRNNGNSDKVYFGGSSKITADMTVAMKLRHLFFGRKAMRNLDRILKSRNITLPTKVHLVKAVVFPVVMYGCETCTINNAECWRIDAFELWFWRRLFRVTWSAMKSNQSILKEISPEYSLEGLMLKLKLQYFGHLMQRTDLLESPWCWENWRWEEKGMTEDEMVGWDQQLDGHEFEQSPGGSSWWTGKPGVLQFMKLKKSDMSEPLNYTDLICSKDSTSANQQCCITRCFLALSFSPLFCLMISQI